MPSLSLALSPSIPQGGWKRGPALSSSPTSPRDPHSCCSSSQVWGRDPQHPPAPCLCSATKLLCSQPLQMALKSLTVCPGRLTSSPNPLTDMQHSRGPPPGVAAALTWVCTLTITSRHGVVVLFFSRALFCPFPLLPWWRSNAVL